MSKKSRGSAVDVDEVYRILWDVGVEKHFLIGSVCEELGGEERLNFPYIFIWRSGVLAIVSFFFLWKTYKKETLILDYAKEGFKWCRGKE